jgi:iron complex outermembrane recepter protein
MRLPRRWTCGLLLCAPLVLRGSPVDDLDEVLVTARKLAEPLTGVPLSIQVVDREELERAGIDGLASLAGSVPGLYVEPMWGGSNAQPTLRGQSHPGPGGNTVGVFVDGVLQAVDNGDDATMFDLERVEVVKGPQSAMYGSSTFAGAINFVTRRPTRSLQSEVKVTGGSGDYGGLSGFVSGPLGTEGLLGRIAAGFRDFGGTGRNAANPHDNLGGYGKWGSSLALEYSRDPRWRIVGDFRISGNRSEQPDVATVTARQYNCGSQDPVTHYWSFYCGDLPRTRHFDVSADVPDSSTRTLQASLRIERSGEDWSLNSLTSYFRSTSSVYQDWDGSSAGELLGVCTVGSSCDSPGLAAVNRLVNVNQVVLTTDVNDQVTQELRYRQHARNADWMAGVQTVIAADRAGDGLGVGPVTLMAGELLTALLPATPGRVGPVSVLNGYVLPSANLVQDSESTQLRSTTTSVFGALDYRFGARASLHAELRQGIGAFTVTTPRASLDYRVAPGGLLWASVARGATAGGSNHDARLMASEQNYGAESEWTYETGFRGSLWGQRLSLSATAFYNDWRNAQIPGPSNTPDVDDFIVRNIHGIRTPGVEAQASFKPSDSLSVTSAYTYDHPRFKSGSEDYGGGRFCGLSAHSVSSNFCTIGPSRVLTQGPALLVPYVDGNVLQRAPEQQWSAALTVEPPHGPGQVGRFFRLAVEHQGRVFVRPVDGAYDGARTVLNARMGLSHGHWSVEVWGTNLTDENYIRAVASRGRVYFPTVVQPQDTIYGDRRRFGVDLRWQL